MEFMWEDRRHSWFDPHKMDAIGSYSSQSCVPSALKGGPSRLVPMELYKLLIFSLDFTNKEESFKKENLLKEPNRERQKHALLPKHTPTHRLYSSLTFESCDLMVGRVCHAKQSGKHVFKNNH